jgi:hypothetical protein
MTMPAVVLTTDGRIALQDRPRPTLRRDQVLVEVDLCGICGSDLHAWQLPQVYRGDCILGHESTGRIAEVGDDVADWAVGQRVAVNPNGNVDGTCAYCRSGRPNFCRQATLETALGLQADGALAPLMAAFPGHLRRIPDEMGTLEAAWVEPTATALRAVELAGELAGRTVLVTGGGPIEQQAVAIQHQHARRPPHSGPAAIIHAIHPDVAIPGEVEGNCDVAADHGDRAVVIDKAAPDRSPRAQIAPDTQRRYGRCRRHRYWQRHLDGAGHQEETPGHHADPRAHHRFVVQKARDVRLHHVRTHRPPLEKSRCWLAGRCRS